RLHQPHAVRRRRREHLLALRRRQRQRLLAQHVLAALRRTHGPLQVLAVRQRDVHRVDVVPLEQRVIAFDGLRNAVLSREPACPAAIPARDRDEPPVVRRADRRDHGCGSDPGGAEYCPAEFHQGVSLAMKVLEISPRRARRPDSPKVCRRPNRTSLLLSAPSALSAVELSVAALPPPRGKSNLPADPTARRPPPVQLTTLDWTIVALSIAISFLPAILLARRAGRSTADRKSTRLNSSH